jgi:hypothetical protein
MALSLISCLCGHQQGGRQIIYGTSTSLCKLMGCAAGSWHSQLGMALCLHRLRLFMYSHYKMYLDTAYAHGKLAVTQFKQPRASNRLV